MTVVQAFPSHGDVFSPAETRIRGALLHRAQAVGPWTKVYDHVTRRNLWCPASPCHLIQEPGSTALTVGTPRDWLGLFAQAMVQKFLFTKPLGRQALLTDRDWKLPNRYIYPPEDLHMLHVIPLNLTSVLR